MRPSTLWILFALWAAAYAVSVLQFNAAPEGDGFTRGLNRLEGFLQWQVIAAIPALLLLALRRSLNSAWQRSLMLLPAALLFALILIIAGVVAWAYLGVGA